MMLSRPEMNGATPDSTGTPAPVAAGLHYAASRSTPPRGSLEACQGPCQTVSLSAFFNQRKQSELQGVVMANTAQARKRARQSVERNARNAAQRSELRTAIKK